MKHVILAEVLCLGTTCSLYLVNSTLTFLLVNEAQSRGYISCGLVSDGLDIPGVAIDVHELCEIFGDNL
jgi:hypothetical protein